MKTLESVGSIAGVVGQGLACNCILVGVEPAPLFCAADPVVSLDIRNHTWVPDEL